MATLAAVDLGAQSGRVARRRASTASGSTVDEVHRFPNVPVAARRRRSAGTSLRLYRDVTRRAPRRRRDAGRSTRSPSTRGRVDFGLARREGPAAAEPRALPRRPPRRARSTRVLERVPAARALRAHRHPAAADQHRLRARRRWSPRTTRRSTAAETLLLIPDLVHYWLCGRAIDRVHERDDDAVLRPARRRLGAPTCSSGSTIPAGLLPEVVAPGTLLGPLADVASRDGARTARP